MGSGGAKVAFFHHPVVKPRAEGAGCVALRKTPAYILEKNDQDPNTESEADPKNHTM